MVEPKISLSLLVPGAGMLSSQVCEQNPKECYSEHKMLLSYTKGKGKYQKVVKKPLIVKLRKQKLVSQNINLCDEAYHHMLSTPTSPKLAKPTKVNAYGDVVERVWDTLSENERLKSHLDLIAHDLGAVSYSFEVLGD